MRNQKSISPSVLLGGAGRAGTPRSLALCCVLLFGALSGCGSVQTTSSGGAGSSLEGLSSPQPPVISGIPPTSAQVGIPYDYAPTVSDALSSALTFDITNMPAWASFNTATGELKGTPGAGNVGISGAIEIGVSDGIGRSTVGPFRITVAQSPLLPTAPPTISGIPPTSAVAGQMYLFTPSASDSTGNPLTFLIVNRPTWASFNTSTGELSGKPAMANVGSYPNVVIGVSNGTTTTLLPAFTVTVSAPPAEPVDTPTIGGSPATTVDTGSAYSFTPTASDPAGRALSFAIQNQPAWASFDTHTGQLSGTPTAADIGSYPNIGISVSDATSTASLPVFTITVSQAPVDGPPTISGRAATAATAGAAYSFTPSASDPAGRALTFSIQNQPAWLSFDTSTGRISGTPTAADVGSFPGIAISVSDGTQSASLPPFAITVSNPVDGPPTISGRAATAATAGAAYSFTPTATDPAGRALTFSIQNRPAWLSFDTSTGRISGTPTAADVGSFPGIAISVSDGTQSASLPPFAITVSNPVDATPTITGVPATSVVVGSTYSFTPGATDPEGHPLTFSIQNRPAWAGFNAGTGELSGTPAPADMGSYTNIVISVTNGTSSASLPAFNIAVTQGSSGTVTVIWSIPTQNTNGTPLVGLAGFRVFYGTDPNNLTQSEQVPDPGATSHAIANLAPGTWFIGLEDYTNSGATSGLSNIGKATIQ